MVKYRKPKPFTKECKEVNWKNLSTFNFYSFKKLIQMKYTVDKQESYTILTPQDAQLNSIVAPELKTELIMRNNEGSQNLILDMAAVEFIDSSGLSAILVGHRMCANQDGVLVLCGMQSYVERLINISQLDSILNITADVESARDFVMRREFSKEISGNQEDIDDSDDPDGPA